jgi:Asp-tRNA(Asn)/Glu-tRNA(Gln) amidotransferase C subunit
VKRKSVDAQFVAHLAEIAGFHFSAERAELLVPQLNWLLGEAQKIAEVDRAGLEPVNFFAPAVYNRRAERDDR